MATFDFPYINVQDIFGENQLRNSEEIMHDDKENADLLSDLSEIGYESHYMTVPLGSMYLLLVIITVVFVLISILTVVLKIPNVPTCLFKVQQKLKKRFLWDLPLRTFIEAALELSFCCMLNIPYLHKLFLKDILFFEALDYAMSVVCIITVLTLPVFIAIFYNKNFGRL